MKNDADLNKIAIQIRSIPNVTKVSIITKEMALERLRSRIGAQSKAVTLLGENPLPSSIEIHVDEASQVGSTAMKLSELSEIEDVVYAGHVAEKLTKVSGFVEKFSFVLLLFSIAASTIVLFNTIRISVYSRESEIGVMLKVGATPTYIMLPFLIQGFILGLVGSLAASIILGATYYSAIARLKDMLPFLPFIESPRLVLKLAMVLVSCGTAVSLISSLFAVEGFIGKAAKPL